MLSRRKMFRSLNLSGQSYFRWICRQNCICAAIAPRSLTGNGCESWDCDLVQHEQKPENQREWTRMHANGLGKKSELQMNTDSRRYGLIKSRRGFSDAYLR